MTLTSSTKMDEEMWTDGISTLGMRVGRASGKLQDGAFINDDDWKREVKALFIIRELVLTEKSYARHLEALLQAVCILYPYSSVVVASSRTNGTVSRSSKSTHVPLHIALMQKLLPQLIALSHTLSTQIDEDPTAAGVGAAFRLVGHEMESIFVAWSSVVQDIMSALRHNEKSKSKGKDRLGLISLDTTEQSNKDVQQGELKAFHSSPGPVKSALNSRKSLTLHRDTLHLKHSLTPSFTPFASDSLTKNRLSVTTRRDSFHSSQSHSFTATLRAKATGTNEASKKRIEVSTEYSTTTQGQTRKRRGSESTVSRYQSTPVTGEVNKGEATIWDPDTLHVKSSLVHSTSTTATPTHSTTPSSTPSLVISKNRLGPLDIAIMPTQRIPRYLLLLRDLNSNTPPQSLSHVRLQRSLDFVKKIASSCDRASKAP
jgi:hypothetical protein